MTIRSTESSGTDMRFARIGIVLLALLLLLTSCSARFARDEDGYGYTDTKTDRHYRVLDAAYEAARVGEKLGEYKDRKNGVARTFHSIPDLDPRRFLADATGMVLCADETLPDATEWEIASVLVCDEDAVSIVIKTLTDKETASAVADAWFSGEEAELPLDKATHTARVKLTTAELPNLLYCFSFYVYENGDGYCYDATQRRAIALSSEMTALLCDAAGWRRE